MKQNFMKALALTLLLASASVHITYAQNQKNQVKIDSGKNLIKLNLGSFLFKTVNVQYERALAKKVSVGIGFRTMAEGNLPFSSKISSLDENLGNVTLGNFAITPEVKFYMGNGVFKGFYVAPFLRYAQYKTSLDLDYTVQNVTDKIGLSGELKTYTAGILIGAQWRLAKNIYFDWSIFGPQYGASDGNIAGKKALTTEMQEELRKELNNIVKDIPIGDFKYEVNENGVNVDAKGPWAGIRANLGIGFRF